MKIERSIYDLKQSGILSHQRMVKYLARYGYLQCHFSSGLFILDSNGTIFSLVIENFLVKYKDTAADQHLIACLQELNEITIDTASVQKYIDYVQKTFYGSAKLQCTA